MRYQQHSSEIVELDYLDVGPLHRTIRCSKESTRYSQPLEFIPLRVLLTDMPTESETFELLGKTVFVIQQMERTVVACLMLSETYDAGEGGLREILKQDKATLGRLMQYLNQAVSPPQDFSDKFQVVLERRNLLIHNFIMEKWVNAKNEEGRAAIHAFLQDFLKDVLQVMLFLQAYVRTRLGKEIRPEVLDYAHRYYEAAARTTFLQPS